jgi:hypothetical protein
MSQSSSQYNYYYDQACEFVVPIKLAVPMFLEPKVFIQPTPCVRESIQVYLEPEIYLEPEVSAEPPKCLPEVAVCYGDALPGAED